MIFTSLLRPLGFLQWLTLAAVATAISTASGAPLAKNLASDYGADPGQGDVTAVLQRAVDELAANPDGGTLTIPASDTAWTVSRPILVGAPNIVIAGQGMGTTVRQQSHCSLFHLGVKAVYPETPLGEGHFPAVAEQTPPVLDASVKQAVGLRTTDGKVRAAGFFPLCPFTLGARHPRFPNNGTHYAEDPVLTLDLCVRNNGTGTMRGVVCGVGEGPRGDISDPVTIWTVESDPQSGKDLAFKFKLVDAQGHEKIYALALSAAPVGQGTVRISVQIDLKAGIGCAWFSASLEKPVPLQLADRVTLPAGCRFKKFEYGALRLGRVVDQPFDGSPAEATDRQSGDWTFCGLYLGDGLRYKSDSTPGTLQARQDGGVLDDAFRYFTRDAGSIAFLPGTPGDPDASRHLVQVTFGQRVGDQFFYGYWLPMRRAAADTLRGTAGVRSMRIELNAPFSGAPIVLGEVGRVSITDVASVVMNGHGVTDWGCHPPNCPVEVSHVAFDALEAMYYGKSQQLDISHFNGRPGWTALRLVGCRGSIRSMLVGDSDNTDRAYFLLHSGPHGGPLRIANIFFDNEGYENPGLGGSLFYAEPSLDPGLEGNSLDISVIYNATMYAKLNQAVIELAGTPGNPQPPPPARLSMRLLGNPNSPQQHPYCLVRCSSSQWHGRVEGFPQNDMLLTYGPIAYTGPEGQCHIQTVQLDATGLPRQGAWLANCHLLRIPDAVTAPGSGTMYRCVRSGDYGTDTPPVWDKVSPQP
jgi:hypothetical protein